MKFFKMYNIICIEECIKLLVMIINKYNVLILNTLLLLNYISIFTIVKLIIQLN